jgi:hypothetical protein
MLTKSKINFEIYELKNIDRSESRIGEIWLIGEVERHFGIHYAR